MEAQWKWNYRPPVTECCSNYDVEANSTFSAVKTCITNLRQLFQFNRPSRYLFTKTATICVLWGATVIPNRKQPSKSSRNKLKNENTHNITKCVRIHFWTTARLSRSTLDKQQQTQKSGDECVKYHLFLPSLASLSSIRAGTGDTSKNAFLELNHKREIWVR